MMYKKITKLRKSFSSVCYLASYLTFIVITSQFREVYSFSDYSFINDETLKSVYNTIEPSKIHSAFFNFLNSNDENFLKSAEFTSLELDSPVDDKSENKSIYESKIDRAPPSYSILMNFQNDGTTSVQVFANDVIYWNDKGLCKHGQLFDPNINQCRDVFCVEGYVFTKDGCQPDPNFNKTQTFNGSIPNDLELELTLLNKICNDDINDCSTNLLMDSPEAFIDEFRKALSRNLHINSTRIQNITILSNDTFIKYIPINASADSNNDEEIMNNTFESYMRENLKKENLYERVKLSLIVKDNKLYPDDNEETLVLYYKLLKLSMDYYEFELFGKNVAICNVTEVKSSQNWCKNPDTKMLRVNGFSILASFDNNGKAKYYVYLNETDSVYGTGDFVLSIGYIPKVDFNFTKVKKSEPPQVETFEKLRKLKLRDLRNLQDVTNVVLGSFEDGLTVQKMLTVCNRYPRISTTCPDHETIRFKTCELTILRNRTACYINKCYSINEYEYDTQEPDHIRVCKFENQRNNSLDYMSHKIKIASSLQGYISFISNILSLTAMIITLITFALFNELRNIPGWNCINLTIALSIAQFSFLLGSLVTNIPLTCFIAAILTHYGFLAAFFCMNIIAFDLYRNFRTKSSHILINTINLKSRLIKYAIYAWLSPLIIVLICITIDLTASRDFIFKPCYASYFNTCSAKQTIFQTENKIIKYNNASIINGKSINSTMSPCVAAGSDPYIETQQTIVQPCWIRNGNSNLLFFGAPIGIIILINAIFYIITVYNIRKKRQKQRHNKIRRFSRVKCPGDDDIKFYIRMAVIMGFTWAIGFLLTTFKDTKEFKIINEILIYAFILSNASMGVFIFFVFIFKKEVKDLYVSLLKGKSEDLPNKKPSKIITFLRLIKSKLELIRERFKKTTMPREPSESTSSETSIN